MSAVEGAIAGWNTADLIPQRDKPYGDIALRLMRYNVALAYYHNSIYDQLAAHSSILRREERLYKFIRGIVNPVRSENNLYVSYTYRGTIDTETLSKGALPLRFDNKQLIEPLKQLVKWSNLDQQLGAYVRDAALLGDAAWWIVDDPFRQRVRLELLDPARVRYVERDEAGNVRAAVIEYECSEEPDVDRYQPARYGGLQPSTSKTYLKSVKATKDSFQTFKDGEPFAYYRDVRGNPVSEWDNPYGFVPLKLAQFQSGKEGWGQNSFFGVVRRQIDELNDQASIINDAVRSAVVPTLQAVGMSSKDKIVLNREDKDDIPILFLPNEKAELKPVTIPLDIAAAAANREVLMSELERNMPVLAMQRIRDLGGNLSGIAIQNMFSDAIGVIENVRKNLNPPLVDALQMAVTIGGIQGYDGFGAFNINSYDAGNMEMSVAETPVIADTLSRAERIDKLVQIAPMPTGSKRQALIEMGFTEADADGIITDDALEAEEKTRLAVRGFAQGVFGEMDDDEEQPVADTETAETTAAEETTPARAAAA